MNRLHCIAPFHLIHKLLLLVASLDKAIRHHVAHHIPLFLCSAKVHHCCNATWGCPFSAGLRAAADCRADRRRLAFERKSKGLRVHTGRVTHQCAGVLRCTISAVAARSTDKPITTAGASTAPILRYALRAYRHQLRVPCHCSGGGVRGFDGTVGTVRTCAHEKTACAEASRSAIARGHCGVSVIATSSGFEPKIFVRAAVDPHDRYSSHRRSRPKQTAKPTVAQQPSPALLYAAQSSAVRSSDILRSCSTHTGLCRVRVGTL